jgi:hypothetical protein
MGLLAPLAVISLRISPRRMVRTPWRTRRAYGPVIGTPPGSPMRPEQAYSGGVAVRMVASSIKMTGRGRPDGRTGPQLARVAVAPGQEAWRKAPMPGAGTTTALAWRQARRHVGGPYVRQGATHLSTA